MSFIEKIAVLVICGFYLWCGDTPVLAGAIVERYGELNVSIDGFKDKSVNKNAVVWTGVMRVNFYNVGVPGVLSAQCSKLVHEKKTKTFRIEGCREVSMGDVRNLPNDRTAACVITSQGQIEFIGPWTVYLNEKP